MQRVGRITCLHSWFPREKYLIKRVSVQKIQFYSQTGADPTAPPLEWLLNLGANISFQRLQAKNFMRTGPHKGIGIHSKNRNSIYKIRIICIQIGIRNEEKSELKFEASQN